MKLVSTEEFARRTATFTYRAPLETPVQYMGTPFECGCGEIHAFCPVEAEHLPETPILAIAQSWLEMLFRSMLPGQWSGDYIVVGCPVSNAATCVRLLRGLNPSIEPLFGTAELRKPEDRADA